MVELPQCSIAKQYGSAREVTAGVLRSVPRIMADVDQVLDLVCVRSLITATPLWRTEARMPHDAGASQPGVPFRQK